MPRMDLLLTHYYSSTVFYSMFYDSSYYLLYSYITLSLIFILLCLPWSHLAQPTSLGRDDLCRLYHACLTNTFFGKLSLLHILTMLIAMIVCQGHFTLICNTPVSITWLCWSMYSFFCVKIY